MNKIVMGRNVLLLFIMSDTILLTAYLLWHKRLDGYNMLVNVPDSNQVLTLDGTSDQKSGLHSNDSKEYNNSKGIPIRASTDNLIYFGSVTKLAKLYNTDGKVRRFTLENDTQLVKRFPQVIGIGVAKCGTGALKMFLNGHPSFQVKMTEANFFNKYFDKGLDFYLNMMPYSDKNKITMEKTPAYFASEVVVKKIYDFDSSLKFLLTVKNPVERSISHYVHFIKRNRKNITFSEAFLDKNGRVGSSQSTIRLSLYAKHLKVWLKYFNRDQILIIDGHKLISDPLSELSKIEQFLHVQKYFSYENIKYNKTKGFYCIKINGEDACLPNHRDNVYSELAKAERLNIQRFKKQLHSFFKPHNKEFYKVAGHDFGWDVS